MFDMANFVEVKRLLRQLAACESRLSPTELEMYRSIKAKYEEPGHTGFDDKICLEVMLRNAEIRKEYGPESGKRADRVIEVTKRRRSKS